MKLKLLLLFLCVVGYGVLVKAQTKKPYNNLLITEVHMKGTPQNYIEFTNMGNEAIDLSNFEFGTISPWTTPFNADENNHFMLPAKQLAAGKSFVIAVGSDFEPEKWLKDPLHNAERVTKPEYYEIADMILHRKENNSTASDSITPKYTALEGWGGRDSYYLRHHYLNDLGEKDSMIIDQVGGIYDEDNGTSRDDAHDVAGVFEATGNSVLIRKNSITTGITEFSSTQANLDAAKLQFEQSRGLDLEDSEWVPVPTLGPREEWRAVFWTVGNQVDAKLDANTLVSKTGKVTVDIANSTITVPWGIRNDDSIMYQFERRPGLAWKYDYAPTSEDSAYSSIRTGDKLTLYVIGNVPVIKEFTLNVLAPTADDNIVIAKNGYDYTLMRYGRWSDDYSDMRITDGLPGMDTISRLDFGMRVDTLFKYLEKAPKATWSIVFKDNVAKPDLTNGDKLRVVSESGKAKEYFLKLEKYVPSSDAYISSITWPDMPASFKGDIAEAYGWKGDTIPGFLPTKNEYVVMIPLDYEGIPALTFHKQQLDSKVEVIRAKTLAGSPEDRTVTFTVTAENDTTINVYHVRFEKEKDFENVQTYIGEPFFSQYVFWDQWANSFLEIANPGTENLDLSGYMIGSGWGGPEDVFFYASANSTDDWANAYYRYVPGRKWVDEASWAVQPSMLETDMAVNAIVLPGDVFVIADIRTTEFNDPNHGNGDTEYRDEIDIDFSRNPWGRAVAENNAVHNWRNASIYMWKILEDSVKNGTKAANDPMDFELIESWGSGSAVTDVFVGGVIQDMIQSNFRKPEIYKPNPVVGGSNGTSKEDSEWYWTNWAHYIALNYGWPSQILRVVDGIGSHIMDEVSIHKSTVASTVYKVSPGFSESETIRGITTGTTVSAFYENIIKANVDQALKVFSNGTELAEGDAISNDDELVVLSADSTNTSKYILEVTVEGLPSNAMLTSSLFTIQTSGATGTISGFDKNTTLKAVYEGVEVPAGATLTIIDQNDAYMTLQKLNYDSTYVEVLATDQIFFEVIAENGTTKILYQLQPTVNTTDAYVTSDIYSVDQFASVIQFIPGGTSVSTLLGNLTPATGATMKVYDKAGFERTSGDIYKDDKLVVTAADNTTTKFYYFAMLNFKGVTYLAYVTSDDYTVNQWDRIISGPAVGTSVNEFLGKLYPSFDATVKVMGSNGSENTGNLVKGDYLLVTAADNVTTATYSISGVTGVSTKATASLIKMYPNPTTGRVIVQGLAKGNRVQVFNSAGVALRDVVAASSTDYVSLEAQPAGIYVFVISSGTQHINIQKIVKK